MLTLRADCRGMDNNKNTNELPLGARVLPGVDLRLWLALVLAMCVVSLLVATIVVAG